MSGHESVWFRGVSLYIEYRGHSRNFTLIA